MKKYAFLFVCVLTVLFFIPCVSFSADVSDVTKKLQQRYTAMKSLKADFKQELLQRDSGVTQKRQGTMMFAKPLLLRWQSNAPNEELFLVTPDEIWNYLPDEELAYRYPREVAEDSRSFIQVITGQSALSKDFDVEAGKENNGKLVHLMLYPKEPTADLTEAQIWVDTSTSLISRAIIMDFYGNTNTIEFTNMKTDVTATEKDFLFTPPKGTEVEDHVGKKGPAGMKLLD